MKTLPLSDAKSQFSSLVEQVRSLEEHVVITRNGRPAAVLVSAQGPVVHAIGVAGRI